MATINFGAKNPVEISDTILQPYRQQVSSGTDINIALTGVLTDLSNQGFSVNGMPVGAYLDNLKQGAVTPFNEALKAVLQNQEQPTQYTPGSLQQGQTPQVVEGTAPAPEPNEQPNLQAQRLSQGTGQAQQTQQTLAQVAQAPALPKSTYTGPSIVDYLNSVGQDSSFASRARLAQQAGIQNYTGTASQNTQLLNSLRSQQTTQTASTIPAGGFTLDQIRQQASLTPAQNLAQEQAKQQAVTTTSPAQTAMQSYGIQADDTSLYQAAQSNPVQFVTDLYNQMYRTAGLGDIKNQYETINKEYEDLQNELSDKIQDINDNPWLTEGVRQRQIRSLQARYEDRLGNLTNRLTLSQSLYESGVAEVRFVTDLAVGQYNAELSRQQDLYLKTLDNAQRQAEAEFDQQFKLASLAQDQSQFEAQLALSKFKATQTGGGGSKILSVSEAAQLGVPYGTTQEEAANFGVIPSTTGQLGTEATKTRENAESGLRALQTIRDELSTTTLLKAAIPGSLFARKYETAVKEAADVITRLRTGAAINANEEKFYRSQLPTLLDLTDPGTIKYKLQLLEDLFSSFAGAGGGTSANDPLGIL